MTGIIAMGSILSYISYFANLRVLGSHLRWRWALPERSQRDGLRLHVHGFEPDPQDL
jgi:hypothetical protein